jgi:hypothetical protein
LTIIRSSKQPIHRHILKYGFYYPKIHPDLSIFSPDKQSHHVCLCKQSRRYKQQKTQSGDNIARQNLMHKNGIGKTYIKMHVSGGHGLGNTENLRMLLEPEAVLVPKQELTFSQEQNLTPALQL